MTILTTNESQILYLSEIEQLSQEEIADKLNYSIRQIQRIKRSASKKIINKYIVEEFKENNKKPIEGLF